MNPKQPIKLFSWNRAIFLIVAALAAVGYRLFQEYQKKGHLDSVDYWVAGITVVIVLGVLSFVGWWANRPD